jgi:membrane-bound lytic murein transglycosylase A
MRLSARAQAPRRGVVASLVCAIICFTTIAALAEGPLKFADSQFEPIKWSELAGWTADEHLAAFAAYQTSCQALRKRRIDDRGRLSVSLSNVCRKAADLQPQDANTARTFFEENFQPVRIGRLGETEGLLTGYFEPIVAGSRFPSPEFPVPFYRRPRDLVAVGYKPGTRTFPNKGVQIGRRDKNNTLVPYHDRGAIEAGALDGQKLEICWLRDSLDLLAIQLQGSGRVILEDGTPLRVNFDSHNGYRFGSIERVLIERNLMSREEISAQRIRGWMSAHPEEATKVRAANRSYVFFRITGLSNDEEPVGAQGVRLTPGRSIAVDPVHVYGTPFFIEANLPIESGKRVSSFGRLMIAQDTGSAIVGPARADLYWGAGDEAGRIAGRIRHPGRFVMLLPRELDIVAAGGEVPLPAPKPKIAALEVTKQAGKGKVELTGTGAAAAGRKGPSALVASLEGAKQDGKGKANATSAGTMAAGRQKPLPAPTKLSEIEARKQGAKGKANSANVGEIAARGKQKPSPVLKPKNSAIEVKKQDGKAEPGGGRSGTIAAGGQKPLPAPTKISEIEARKQSAKGKANPASVGEILDSGKQKPSLASKSKTPMIETKKQNGKGKEEAVNAGENGRAAAKSGGHAAPNFFWKRTH